MADDDLVSVVVPVSNVERYLDRCVASLLAQTHESIEIIVVDDGSTDTSGGICEMYVEQEHHARVIHQSNGSAGRFGSPIRPTRTEPSMGDRSGE